VHSFPDSNNAHSQDIKSAATTITTTAQQASQDFGCGPRCPGCLTCFV